MDDETNQYDVVYIVSVCSVVCIGVLAFFVIRKVILERNAVFELILDLNEKLINIIQARSNVFIRYLKVDMNQFLLISLGFREQRGN
jgi:hypothetical protein